MRRRPPTRAGVAASGTSRRPSSKWPACSEELWVSGPHLAPRRVPLNATAQAAIVIDVARECTLQVASAAEGAVVRALDAAGAPVSLRQMLRGGHVKSDGWRIENGSTPVLKTTDEVVTLELTAPAGPPRRHAVTLRPGTLNLLRF